MEEADDFMPVQAPAVIAAKDPVKLPSLRPILNARKIERKVFARQTGIDLNRLGNIIGTSTRATGDEIERITRTLEVTLEQLLEPDTSPPRRRNSNMNFADEPDDEDDEVSRDALPALPVGDVILNIALPDGRKFSVASNQTLSVTMLSRMTQALAVLAGANDEK